MPKKLFNVKVYSGRGDSNLYSNLTRRQTRMLVRDLRSKNRHLKHAFYPQRWTYKIEGVTK